MGTKLPHKRYFDLQVLLARAGGDGGKLYHYFFIPPKDFLTFNYFPAAEF